MLIPVSSFAGVVLWSIVSKKGELLCKMIGIKWSKHFKTKSYDEIDPSKYKPKLVSCPSPYNCVCTTLGVILTKSIKAALANQDWVQKIRRARFLYLYDEYENELPASGLDNTCFITPTDNCVIVRELIVTIYEYFEQSTEWIVYHACHKGPEHRSIFLSCRYLESRASIIVWLFGI